MTRETSRRDLSPFARTRVKREIWEVWKREAWFRCMTPSELIHAAVEEYIQNHKRFPLDHGKPVKQ